MKKKKHKEISEFTKEDKIKALSSQGWYELKTTNNWVDGTNVPKNWKGVTYDVAFEKIYKKIK